MAQDNENTLNVFFPLLFWHEFKKMERARTRHFAAVLLGVLTAKTCTASHLDYVHSFQMI